MSTVPLGVPQIEQGEAAEQTAEIERLHRVLVHNDEVTPYDFVLVVLVRFFKLPPADAEQVTRTAHNSGLALVAVLPLPEARKRVGRAHFAASLEGYPLTFTIEPE
ncbi:MAG: ATP-dependent Clp protease adaptor ClpS [Chloroflexota bacterium]|nr:MAG: ATP-dependent Clp protease adaptor ClpS [Chloroflexota bacterium]